VSLHLVLRATWERVTATFFLMVMLGGSTWCLTCLEHHRLVRIPNEGVVETSDEPMYGEYHREWIYEDVNGRRRSAPGAIAGGTIGYRKGERRFYFFVGTGEDLAKANARQGDRVMPVPGRMQR
jgi:hypothetical protein